MICWTWNCETLGLPHWNGITFLNTGFDWLIIQAGMLLQEYENFLQLPVFYLLILC